MTNLHIVAKCNFCKEIIRFTETDVLYFDISSVDDDTEKIFHKCKFCGKENNFELSLKQMKEFESKELKC